MATHDDDLIAYLAGESQESLPAGERVELNELRELLADEATWAQPDAQLEDRVVSAIEREVRARPGDDTSPDHARSRGRERRRRALFSRPAFAFSAVGAIAAVAAAIAVVALNAGSGATPAQQFAMVVSGTPLAPSARGSATLTKTGSGWRIQLSARGLPHLANGRYYEAWLKNPAGVLVPVGTFNDARDVTLWAGVPPTSFPTLSVTRQLADGRPASSGERVLLGTIRSSR
jgi:Anti-sigma-K factor rskA